MFELIQRLGAKERRGSKPRCHFLTHGPADEVAARLTTLTAPFACISPDDCWMPQGFENLEEAQLHRAPRLLQQNISEQLKSWWLPATGTQGRTPNFDIASTCTIDGRPGLLLVEAKAHDEELHKEAVGRRLEADPTVGRRASHESIGAAILAASAGLEVSTSLPWKITRDSHYQMANRFAWAWKLTELGVPVVLVYLGFLNATEMADRGRPFASHEDWERLVHSHSTSLFQTEIWGQRWQCGEQAFIPLIRSLDQPISQA
jgi:hypothetical protein